MVVEKSGRANLYWTTEKWTKVWYGSRTAACLNFGTCLTAAMQHYFVVTFSVHTCCDSFAKNWMYFGGDSWIFATTINSSITYRVFHQDIVRFMFAIIIIFLWLSLIELWAPLSVWYDFQISGHKFALWVSSDHAWKPTEPPTTVSFSSSISLNKS